MEGSKRPLLRMRIDQNRSSTLRIGPASPRAPLVQKPQKERYNVVDLDPAVGKTVYPR
jgi:hypothetical protein